MLTTRSFPSALFLNEFDTLFRNLFTNSEETDFYQTNKTNNEALFETENGWSYLADLPGHAKENLNIHFEKGVLTIKAISKSEHLTDFERQLNLNSEIDTNSITASLKDGALHIQLPKLNSEKQKERKIEIL